MDPKNIKLVRNESYFFVEKYKKDTCFFDEDAYYYYDIDVDRILLFKKSDNKYFIRYKHSNKMDIVSLQLKIKNFYYEIHDDDGYNERIYIENSNKRFFDKIRKIWNKTTELMFIDNAPDFVKTNVCDDEEYIRASILRNTNFLKSTCYKDEIIIALHCR